MSEDSSFSPLDGLAQREEVLLITGISGSGKSVALHALEDAGYFCVDNLPPELLRDFIRLERENFTRSVAVSVDVRTAWTWWSSASPAMPAARRARSPKWPRVASCRTWPWRLR